MRRRARAIEPIFHRCATDRHFGRPSSYNIVCISDICNVFIFFLFRRKILGNMKKKLLHTLINIKKNRQWVQCVETVSNTTYITFMHLHFYVICTMYIVLVYTMVLDSFVIDVKKDFSTFCNSRDLETFFC